MAENNDKFLRGFLLGGAIGAMLALLYAPRSGKETREEIRKRSRELLDDVDEQLKEIRTQAERIIEEGRREAEKLREEAEKRIEEARKRAQELIEQGRATVTTARSDAEKKLEETREKAEQAVEKGKSKLKGGATRLKEAVSKGVKAYKEEVEPETTETSDNK